MSRYSMCEMCGRRLTRVKDVFGNWDGETYCCYYCSRDDDDYDQQLDEGEIFFDAIAGRNIWSV